MSRRLPRNQVMIGDARACLDRLPPESVDCVVTSPPYYLLRDYGVQGQFGLEGDVDGWVDDLRLVMKGIARVLKPSGAVWLNVSDSYSRHQRYGVPAKGMLCAPERLLLALVADGWLVRNKVIWAKPNPMPASVADRLNTTYEVLYFLVRSPRYLFDLDAIRVPHRSPVQKRERPIKMPLPTARPSWAGPLAGSNSGLTRLKATGRVGNSRGKNPGDVWPISTHAFRGAHFATFPQQLVYRPILATCPEAVCTRCHAPLRHRANIRTDAISRNQLLGNSSRTSRAALKATPLRQCGCGAPTMPGVVLDPFMGSGTVAIAAEQLGRDWLGIELNPAYAKLARERIANARTDRQNEQVRDVA
jgi:site-specific DNA-methyltransferase (adenine-specific)